MDPIGRIYLFWPLLFLPFRCFGAAWPLLFLRLGPLALPVPPWALRWLFLRVR